MSLLEAIVLGLVQGLTEFLPISSTAHLRIVPALIKLVDSGHQWNDPGAAASAIIQLGTMAAILVYFRRDILRLTLALVTALRHRRPFDTVDARLAWYVIVGTVPIVVLGVTLEEFIETRARSLWIIAAALIILALFLSLAERLSSRRRGLDHLTWTDAVIIGLAQAAALIPGSSRSGTTITAGLFLGLERETAARFSFLLSIPAVAGSGLYELYRIRSALGPHLGIPLLVATGMALVSGYLAIAFLLRYLRTHTVYIFVWYRIGLGLLLLVLLTRGLV
ncbi:MAG: undecaprenyl-diphosphate phosphatase [Acidobacteria bacterium]|nr:MAG: undecaprenyl-diphosphate phosphatase [Acidobacteriota bacterium]